MVLAAADSGSRRGTAAAWKKSAAGPNLGSGGS
jgi:hypothetical protein